MKAFWSLAGNGRNFGDQLTPFLFEEILGVRLVRTNENAANLFCGGSVVELIPDKFGGYVLGTGAMYAKTHNDLSRAKVLALRGELTRAACNVEKTVLGDFGLALRRIVPRKLHPVNEIGETPHHFIYEAGQNHGTGGFVINMLLKPWEVIERVASCRKIVSSSLHGLVLADALGIESMWVPDGRVNGDGFKFRDYASAFGEEIKPNVWRKAPLDKVESISESLVGLMRGLNADR